MRSIRICVWIVLIVLAGESMPAGGASGVGPVVIGAVEEVVLLPWGVRMRSRVDTGAAVSSLDARTIRVRTVRRQKAVRFVLVGDDDQRVALDLPVSGYRRISTVDGGIEKRPMVEMEICIAGQRLRAEFTLNDRSRMEYRMLVGRNILAGRFLVDVAEQDLVPPACPASQ